MSETKPKSPITVIKPMKGWAPINFAEVWRFRDLLVIFILRDIKVKYKQAFLGVSWAVLQPVVMMAIFSVFMSLAKIPSDELPRPIFTFTALLPWTFFSNAVLASSTTLVTNAQLVSKIYFPRIILPASATLAPLVDMSFGMCFLVILMIWFKIGVSIKLILLLPLILLAVICAMGLGLWLSAINIKYRDVQYTIPMLVQVVFFLSPIMYSSSIIPEKYQFIYGLNPMVSVIEGFRWAIAGAAFPDSTKMLISVCVSLVLFITGAYYFRRTEKEFADVV